MKLLGKIEDSFVISAIAHKYGCIVTFSFVASDGRIRDKDKIHLRTPDGRIKDTYIAAIEHIKYSPGVPMEQRRPGIALPPDITKHDVPAGTEIWVDEEATRG